MKALELAILSYNQWSAPWRFYDYIIQHQTIMDKDKVLFKNLWAGACSFELWNDPFLNNGCENAGAFLRDTSELSEAAVDSIVRAISYEWK